MRIAFSVPGIPVAQPRQRSRAVMVGGKPIAQNFTPAKDPVHGFKDSIRREAARVYPGAPLTQPIALTVILFFPRPAGSTKKRGPNPRLPKVSKPDWDNLGKAVSDALNGILYRDDAQIAHAVVKKIVCTPEEQARTEVILETFTEWA